MAEDPRELARRLAEEAKKRLNTNGAEPPAAPPPPPPPERSLEERAGPSRARSALEALEAAREAERKRSATPPPSAMTPPTTERRVATPGYAPTPRAARAEHIAPVRNADVFRALWRAHRARAIHDGDGALVATASVLLDAIDRVSAGRLHEARVAFGNDTWAAWIDGERGVLLGMARPANVYLSE
jgi:hypothetical protein